MRDDPAASQKVSFDIADGHKGKSQPALFRL